MKEAEMAEETAQESTDAPQEGTQQPETGQDAAPSDKQHKAILADLAKERRERQRLSRELESERAKGLSESERVIAEARAEGRTEAIQEAGKRLARAEIRAAGSEKGLDVAALLEDLDLSRFVGDDGEPDGAAISKAIDRWAAIAPQSTRPRGDVDQGNRGTPPPQSPADEFAAILGKQLGTSR